MRIAPLHVAKYVPPPYAGVEGHVDTLLGALAPHAECTLVAGGSTVAAAQPRPYRVCAARTFGTLASVTLSPSVVGMVRTELCSGRCNLLHVHAPNPWADLAALACSSDVPVVMTWHSDIVRQKRLMLAWRHVQRAVLDRVDRIVVFTPAHADSSVQLHQRDVRRKIVQVPIGIAFDHLMPERADPATLARLDAFAGGRPLLLTVGRHVYYKGYDHLLQALQHMRQDAVLAMVGTGPLTAQLQDQARALGIAARVMFLGEVPQAGLAAAFQRCDVFTLPSVAPSEAFGIASAEAMACGKPTVVCQLGNGVNYLNQDGRTSLTVPPRDPAALGDALDTLAGDPSLRRRMGAAARAWVQAEFSIDAMRTRTLALYRELLDGRA
ncbi:MAG TPA: glycosyltransferase [Ramlibacter sp.]|jgi:rhamnosyl/mannosyltransferase|uniref:glycosyltransferase n=1 Tax=Ramlibacter sp. TaxID=1917967 RepID=UPI002D3E9C21|nr:glycosyltransferase [Ramlibacter sp.]HZY20334.1 glycosyltransferase [Ramlibacter sp.]